MTTPRNSLAIAMLCAWNNIPPDQMPPDWANHPNDQNRQAWERVAGAARAFIDAERDNAHDPFAGQLAEAQADPEWVTKWGGPAQPSNTREG